jgi:hypothetical protein
VAIFKNCHFFFLNKMMRKKWGRPPKDKKQVRRREERWPHIRKPQDRKENSQFKHRFNTKYKKEFDVTNKYQYYSNVIKYLDTFKIYKGIVFLLNNGYFDIDYIGNRKIIPSEQVLEELFRREMCTFRDQLIWEYDKKRCKAKAEKHFEKMRTKRFFIMLPNNKKFCFGKYDTRRASLAKDVALTLLNNLYIFDENSKYYLTPRQIRRMVSKEMHTRAFQKIDFKALILKYQN